MKVSRHIRGLRVGALAATIAVLAAPTTATAHRGSNSFEGSCTGLDGVASFPEHPLTVMPIDMLMSARLSGGGCSGTLNGRAVESLRAAASAALRGPQSCGGGATSGRFAFKLGGRRFAGKMTYRRVGPRVTALWEGDGGGAAVVVVHARIGVVAEDHPLAGAPVVGPVVSDSMSTDEALRRCSEEGLPSVPIQVDEIRTVSALRSR